MDDSPPAVDWKALGADCRIPECGRYPRPDSPYCEDHFLRILREGIRAANDLSDDWTSAKDEGDGGNNEK